MEIVIDETGLGDINDRLGEVLLVAHGLPDESVFDKHQKDRIIRAVRDIRTILNAAVLQPEVGG